YIETSSRNLVSSLAIGALLLVLALGAFLFAWRTALIAVIAMALSLSAALVVRDAVLELRGTGLTVLLISLVVFVPTFFTRGAFGSFFPSIAVSYAVAVVASLLVSLLVTPALGLTLLA